MKTFPLIQSFSAGEVSPLLFMRDDLPVSKNGAKTMENMLSTSHGPAVSRRGSKHIAQLTGLGITVVKSFEFTVSATESYLVMFTNAGLYVADDNGFLSSLVGITELLNDILFTMVPPTWTWITTHPAVISYSTAYTNTRLTVGVTAVDVLKKGGFVQSFTPLVGGNYRFRMSLDILASPVGSGIAVSRLMLCDAVDADGWPTGVNLFPWGAFSLRPSVDTEHDMGWTVALLAGVTYYIAYRAETTTNSEVRTTVLKSFSAQLVGAGAASLVHGIATSDISTLQAEMVPGVNQMYVVQKNTLPKRLTYVPATGTWSIANIVFTAMPATWIAGSYPSYVTFFKGRAYWAGVAAQPNRFWGSQVWNYANMSLGTGLATEAVEYPLARKGAIQGIKGASSLLVLSTECEYVVKAADDGAITPGEGGIEAVVQSRIGSKEGTLLDLANKILFSSLGGYKLYDLGYKWEDDKWQPRDISFVSEHMFGPNIRIIRTAFLADPNRMVAVLCDAGLYLCCYDDINNLIGWQRHPSVDITDLCSLTKSGTSKLIALHVEAGNLSLSHVHASYCLDRYIEFNHAPAATAVSAPHLANQTVGVIGDGVVQADLLLDAAGAGNIATAASHIVIGIRYTQTLRTFPQGYSSVIGSGLAMAKRWNRIWVRLVNSHIPKINGVRSRFKRSDSTAFEVNAIVEDGWIEVSNLGWTADGTVEIVQDLPLPICIAGIYGEMSQEFIEGN
jgi:hypothetical protein